jgi:hypothetical protein
MLFQIGGNIKGGACSEGLALGSTVPSEACGPTNGTTDYPYTSVHEIQVAPMYSDLYPSPKLLATVQLPAQPTLGGGGPAIVDGRIYVPTVAGIAVVGIAPGSNASQPIIRGSERTLHANGLVGFAGPYPEPIAPGGVDATLPPVDTAHPPYPLMLDTELQRLGAYRN